VSSRIFLVMSNTINYFNTMANLKGKAIDTSRLSNEDGIKYIRLHRDYLAHVLRYDHVYKYLKENNRHLYSKVLDVGCGGNTPLAKVMFHNMMKHDEHGCYVGVDYGTIGNPVHPAPGNTTFKAKLYQRTDFLDWESPFKEYDLITCFEVLEHVEPKHAFNMLKRMNGLLSTGGVVMVSTPIYKLSLGAANSHVNEMSYDAVEYLFNKAGFKITQVNGTFASQTDYAKTLPNQDREFFDRLCKYYDPNVVSCLMAPLVNPKQCRNAIWRAELNESDCSSNVMPFGAEHSSSNLWTKFMEELND